MRLIVCSYLFYGVIMSFIKLNDKNYSGACFYLLPVIIALQIRILVNQENRK
jgi:hypothetical protein